MYSIYKTVNKITNKFYVGKQYRNYDYYLGSGKLLKKAISKHGKHNFTKVILEDGLTRDQASIREQFWIKETGALTSQGYNMNPGGVGGDNSKHIDYANRKIKYNTSGLRAHWRSLTPEQRKQKHKEQGMARAKAWYVSRVGSKKEIKIVNLNEWCKQNNVQTETATTMATIGSRLYGKQTKGYRFRREGDPKLPPYENRRHIPTDNGCKGKSWRLVAGKRVWYSK